MRAQYPAAKWKPGDVIRDEQSLTLPMDWPSKQTRILVGLYRQGSGSPDDRLPIVTGPSDDEKRVVALTVDVEGGGPPEPRRAIARRTSAPIVIDGKPEPAWDAAEWTPAFERAQSGPKLRGTTRAKLLADETNLYVLVETEDRDVRSKFENHDDPLWEADAVELFIDADGNRRGYVELQVNPRGVVFDSWFPGTRAPPGGDPSWQSDLKAAATVDGSLGDGASDKGWTAELAIPLQAVKGKDSAMKVNLPPAGDDVWKLNIVRVDFDEGEKSPRVSSWAPITYADFHAIDRLGEVRFEQASTPSAPDAQ